MDVGKVNKSSVIAAAFVCDVCQKKFKSKSNLNVHKRIHSSEKPYKCDVCERKFARKGDSTRHMLIHSGKKDFQCEV